MPPPPRIEIPCPLCRRATPTREVARRGRNVIVSCARCGLRFVNPQPSLEELAAFYDANYFSNNPDKFFRLPMAPTIRSRLAEYVRLVQRPGAGGTVLDIGCGTGFFLLLCREAGMQTAGVELSPVAARHGREEFGLDIAAGTLVQQKQPDGAFGVVTMWDCLEHTRQPLDELAEVRRILRPGGVLCPTVPNSGSLVARLSGSRWMGYEKADEHLTYFTRTTLHAALLRSGFEPRTIRPQAWVCDLEFVLARGESIAPAVARSLRAVSRRLGLSHRSVRFPSVNLFTAAVRR